MIGLIIAFVLGAVTGVAIDRGIIKDKTSSKIVDKAMDIVEDVKEKAEKK